MADIFNINNIAYCASATSVNDVLRTNTHSIDTIIKDCVTEDCYTCGPIQLSIASENCAVACVAACTLYYTVVPPSRCDGCSLIVGDPVFTDVLCTPAADGYYSGKPCDSAPGGGACENCYQVSAGIIIAITACNEGTCVSINTNPEPVGQCGATRDNPFQPGACNEETCQVRYTDGTPGSLVPGNHLYTDSECECAPVPTAPGFYRAWQTLCSPGYPSQCVEVEEGCLITAVQPCREF